MMQEMPELVEDRLYFAMREQRGLAVHRRRQVSADQSQMGLPPLFSGGSGKKRIHPRASPLVLTREPISVERTQAAPVLVINRVEAHGWIPNRRARLFLNLDSVKPVDHVEHSGNHTIERKERPQCLLIEIVECCALFLRVVGDVPGLNPGSFRTFECVAKFLQLLVLLLKSR